MRVGRYSPSTQHVEQSVYNNDAHAAARCWKVTQSEPLFRYRIVTLNLVKAALTKVATNRVDDGRCVGFAALVWALPVFNEVFVDAREVGATGRHRSQYVTVVDLLLQEAGREEVTAHAAQQFFKLVSARARVVFDPANGSEKHFRLASNVKLVLLNDVLHLWRRQRQKLVVLRNLTEVLQRVLPRLLAQIHAVVRVRKLGDPDAVARIELLFEECTTRVDDVNHVEHVGGGEERADVQFTDVNLGRVRELDERLECVGVDALQRNIAHVRLAQTVTEHRLEIGRRSCQDDLVSTKLLRISAQYDVTQLTLVTECVHGFEALLVVLHDAEVHASRKWLLRVDWLRFVAAGRELVGTGTRRTGTGSRTAVD